MSRAARRKPRQRSLAALTGLAAGLALALSAPTAGPRADTVTEYPVKAAFLSKFGDFVDWPEGGFADPAAPAVLCVVGRDPFGPALDRAAQGQRLHGRMIVVRRIKVIDPASGCHLAYLGGGAQDQALALRTLAGAPVLTITDQAPEEARGVIDFTLRDNRVRFRIDDASAARHGLTISSKLLALAISVRPR
jgi:hypothetical protein